MEKIKVEKTSNFTRAHFKGCELELHHDGTVYVADRHEDIIVISLDTLKAMIQAVEQATEEREGY